MAGSCEHENEPSVSIKFWGISSPVDNLLPSHAVLCCTQPSDKMWLPQRQILRT